MSESWEARNTQPAQCTRCCAEACKPNKVWIQIHCREGNTRPTCKMYFYKVSFPNAEVFNDILIKTSGSLYLPLKTREILPCVVGRQTWEINYKNVQTQHIKKQRHYFVNKSQGYGFSSSHVWMWELGYKESWVSEWSRSVVSDSLRPHGL